MAKAKLQLQIPRIKSIAAPAAALAAEPAPPSTVEPSKRKQEEQAGRVDTVPRDTATKPPKDTATKPPKPAPKGQKPAAQRKPPARQHAAPQQRHAAPLQQQQQQQRGSSEVIDTVSMREDVEVEAAASKHNDAGELPAACKTAAASAPAATAAAVAEEADAFAGMSGDGIYKVMQGLGAAMDECIGDEEDVKAKGRGGKEKKSIPLMEKLHKSWGGKSYMDRLDAVVGQQQGAEAPAVLEQHDAFMPMCLAAQRHRPPEPDADIDTDTLPQAAELPSSSSLGLAAARPGRGAAPQRCAAPRPGRSQAAAASPSVQIQIQAPAKAAAQPAAARAARARGKGAAAAKGQEDDGFVQVVRVQQGAASQPADGGVSGPQPAAGGAAKATASSQRRCGPAARGVAKVVKASGAPTAPGSASGLSTRNRSARSTKQQQQQDQQAVLAVQQLDASCDAAAQASGPEDCILVLPESGARARGPADEAGLPCSSNVSSERPSGRGKRVRKEAAGSRADGQGSGQSTRAKVARREAEQQPQQQQQQQQVTLSPPSSHEPSPLKQGLEEQVSALTQVLATLKEQHEQELGCARAKMQEQERELQALRNQVAEAARREVQMQEARQGMQLLLDSMAPAS